jgi:hypothetical protein
MIGLKLGAAMPAKTARMATVTMSSMAVKPLEKWRRMRGKLGMLAYYVSLHAECFVTG